MPTSKHSPVGFPTCEKCQKPSNMHSVKHKFVGSKFNCGKCGLSINRHTVRGPQLITPARRRANTRYKRKRGRVFTYFGIDGEGQGRKLHKYILLAASNESGTRKFKVVNHGGITTLEALTFIMSLPSHNETRIFSFAFNYDMTKMLKDLPDDKLYRLFRPEMRQRKTEIERMKGPIPVQWEGFSINLQGTKFTIKRGKKRVVIWDLFKFYQSKFVLACKDWKVGTKEQLEHMMMMKNQRHLFDKMPFDEVERYCFEECRFMAELARKLVEAHDDAELKLTAFYGAGSSGAAMLKVMGIQDQIVKQKEAMQHAIACAFVGGRFENSVIGKVEGEIWNMDISSAYPYQMTSLPCQVHGEWELSTRRRDLDDAKYALVNYGLEKFGGSASTNVSWAPFPFRTADGSICFPIESGGGWVYQDEYRVGERLFPSVYFKQAWLYKQDCDCQPFRQTANYYIQRLRISKEGAGIVIKLGMNSCYGKLAQSIGNALFNSWLWAGMVTSGCRAQCLELMGLHQDRANLLMIATDGVYTREKIIAPLPRDTGTFQTGKPLGGWETTPVPNGAFIARPGIYFPLSPTEADLKSVKGRGVGKGVILSHWERIVSAWERKGLFRTVIADGVTMQVPNTIVVDKVSRFCGAKTSISKSVKGYTRADGTKKRNDDGPPMHYGEWIDRYVEMGFDPMPKRETALHPDGKSLIVRRMPLDLPSVPYKKAMISKDSYMMKMGAQELMEQPDIDLADYDCDFLEGAYDT